MPVLLRPCDLPHCTLVPMPAEVDLYNRPDLFDGIRRIVDGRAGRIDFLVLDFSETVFMDSQGVSLIDAVRAHLRGLPGEPGLRVVAGARIVRRVLDITHARRDVAVYEDASEALFA
ncbi:STAS domain-containing protein [Streptomyces sp. NPDC060194]|uniref:STAS domain-containing protein n=1 Tax=Streptomyces sp. NPDC060194 TaxID=3347069 RepID=UPI00364F8E8E